MQKKLQWSTFLGKPKEKSTINIYLSPIEHVMVKIFQFWTQHKINIFFKKWKCGVCEKENDLYVLCSYLSFCPSFHPLAEDRVRLSKHISVLETIKILQRQQSIGLRLLWQTMLKLLLRIVIRHCFVQFFRFLNKT